MSKTLKATLISLVEQSKTNILIADHLHTLLSQTTDWRDRQQIQGAIRFAERNAAKL